jgi:hypothetical protein
LRVRDKLRQSFDLMAHRSGTPTLYTSSFAPLAGRGLG